ncbi:MAG: tRNA (adenosine(37)-N6)-dimethylallyltransferase MiaA [Chloroflexi bacterium GWB2_49_20]|nr:MAG: tRNA (adenosine(37)-N6)-dimethylallyltransferase MiaA [Chloroflexi bacterium GWB2_49_20]OGN79996.1 MAG: tRNA (adenosine(37)-N6)-dimethylallyltransferase MiaA [Chloroflexi bacterium GWC2_49_37]OGN85468.1 MAG: tRNA (adenosine(37)-N6)-dimethylallyltransferase MiaA [Chloroflexi bacterium GWD2_49_16]
MDNPLIVIVGPTCVGKTEVSIYLAEKLNGEIISADSRTFYRGMDIGTAKPTQEEQMRVPHHLVDVTNPDQTWNLAVFQQNTQAIIREIHLRKHIPFLVGGTGQYIRAVTNNWSPPTIIPNLKLRGQLEILANERSKEYLHQALFLLDPEAAKMIDPRNVRRTIRALEVIFSSGILFSSQRKKGLSPFRLITIGLTRPRIELYDRIDQRIYGMFANGLVNEVKELLNSGFSPYLQSMSAIGYRECANVVSGYITEEQAIEEIKRKTRIFVRRQFNWFKSTDPEIRWFNISEQPISDIENYLHLYLKRPLNT